MARLRQPNTKLIHDLCGRRNWGLPEFIRKAPMKRETARNIWDGGKCLRCTLEDLAGLFNLDDWRALLSPDDSDAMPTPTATRGSKRLLITIVIEGDADAIAEAGIVESLNRMQAAIRTKAPLEPKTYRTGSLYLIVPVSIRDACALIRALASGALDDLYVSMLMLPPEHFFRQHPLVVAEAAIRLIPRRLCATVMVLTALLVAPLFFPHPPWTYVIPPAQLSFSGRMLWLSGIALSTVMSFVLWMRRGVRVFNVSGIRFVARDYASARHLLHERQQVTEEIVELMRKRG